MIPSRSTVVFVCLLFCISWSVRAQDNEKLKEQILKEWQQARIYTQKYLDAMPADKYDFQPTKEVRSFAKQMLHLTYINIGWVSLASGRGDNPLKITALTNVEETFSKSKDSVTYYTLTSYDFVIQEIKAMDAAKLFDITKRNETKLAWINRTFEHQTHQRAQCVMYFRLLGLKPPHTL